MTARWRSPVCQPRSQIGPGRKHVAAGTLHGHVGSQVPVLDTVASTCVAIECHVLCVRLLGVALSAVPRTSSASSACDHDLTSSRACFGLVKFGQPNWPPPQALKRATRAAPSSTADVAASRIQARERFLRYLQPSCRGWQRGSRRHEG